MSALPSMKLAALLCCVVPMLARAAPRPTSGEGLYVSIGSSYCIPYGSLQDFFCPERFSHGPTGGVTLWGQLASLDSGFASPPVQQALAAGGQWNGKAVEVLSVDTDHGELFVTIQQGNSPTERLSGQDLEDLVLEFPQGAPLFHLKIEQAASENGFPLYTVHYNVVGTSFWRRSCLDSTPTAMLTNKAVHSVSALVSPAQEDITLACRSGAIATCLVAGYSPDGALDAADQLRKDFAYGACLQAVRGAYFGQSGNFKPYGGSNTPLALQDKALINTGLMPGVEAVWTPEGASCLSPQYRRVPPAWAEPLPELPSDEQLPLCDGALHSAAQGGWLHTLLEYDAPLATGPNP